MKYVDFFWDLTPTLIVPDPALNTDRLNWKIGDLWQVVQTEDGRKILKKADPLVQFTLGSKNG